MEKLELEYFEIAYWIISLVILGCTVYWIYKSPIKAVQIGRDLDNEQNKYNAKRELFLLLFSLRGNPTNYDFVNGLNQIEVVFQDNQNVLTSWNKLYDSLNRNVHPDDSIIREWELLRTELLSEMAQSLGYNKLKQTTIQRSYYPQAHVIQSDESLTSQRAAREYFETGAQMHKIFIEQNEVIRDLPKENEDQ